MKNMGALPVTDVAFGTSSTVQTSRFAELKTELVRKSLHVLIALVPTLASITTHGTVALLAAGILVYTFAEYFRLNGFTIPIVSALTVSSARLRDRDRFVLGPVTLGLGAMFALLLYPSPAASIAIYALAFGDSIASLVGKFIGHIRPKILKGKSLEGSLACFTVCWIVAFNMTHSAPNSILIALTATLIEAFPFEDYDNIALPVSVGMVATVLML